MSNVQEILKKYKKAKSVMVKEVSELLITEILEIARSVKGLESIRWKQYTPYFNDGEACTFRVNDPEYKFEDDDESGDYEDGYVDTWDLEKKHPAVAKELDKISKLICDNDIEEILMNLYDDHAEVTIDVKTGKVSTNEYSHD